MAENVIYVNQGSSVTQQKAHHTTVYPVNILFANKTILFRVELFNFFKSKANGLECNPYGTKSSTDTMCRCKVSPHF